MTRGAMSPEVGWRGFGRGWEIAEEREIKIGYEKLHRRLHFGGLLCAQPTR